MRHVPMSVRVLLTSCFPAYLSAGVRLDRSPVDAAEEGA